MTRHFVMGALLLGLAACTASAAEASRRSSLRLLKRLNIAPWIFLLIGIFQFSIPLVRASNAFSMAFW